MAIRARGQRAQPRSTLGHVLRLRFDNDQGSADLVRHTGGALVARGFDLETAVIVSLFSDARAGDGDALPPGTPRRGWWGETFEPAGARWGSMLWLLERATASRETGLRAETYARDALAWLVRERHVRHVSASHVVEGEALLLLVDLTLLDRTTRRFGPFQVGA